jgi:hypothetical protein
LRSIELAGWRHYSAIGLGEMAQEPRANQKKIEAEYKGATARYAAAIRAAAEWDRKAGLHRCGPNSTEPARPRNAPAIE